MRGISSVLGIAPPRPPVWVETYSTTIGGEPLFMLTPEGNPGSTKLVIYNHGAGGDQDSLTTTSTHNAIKAELLTRGWCIASSRAFQNNWGSESAITHMQEIARWARAVRSIHYVALWGVSMGAMATLVAYSRDLVRDCVGWLGCSPVVDGDWLPIAPDNFKAQWISTGAPNPYSLDASTFTGKHLRWHAHQDDARIIYEHNALAGQIKFGGTLYTATTPDADPHTAAEVYQVPMVCDYFDSLVT